MFEVVAPDIEIEFMTAERKIYPSLDELRKEITENGKEVYVYAPEFSTKIFGYGRDAEWLSSKGFTSELVRLIEEPRLTGRIILEGVIEKAKEFGYLPLPEKEKGRRILYNENDFKETSDGNVRVYKLFDIRVIFLRDLVEDKLKFYLIVDVKYSLKDKSNNPLNFKEITSKFGSNTLREIRQIQKDLIPTGRNPEVSRQRLLEDIIPFVENIKKIYLPCGIEAEIVSEPTRIIVGV
ncbi:MAG: hypothetical protein J7K36_08865 [Archaeoglobaceae archaeon]|nr:hypothetical protein [Archaeoglobaceae archaeon]